VLVWNVLTGCSIPRSWDECVLSFALCPFLLTLPSWWAAQKTDCSVLRPFYIGLVCIPNVTKVTLFLMRLWQTVTSFMVISYIAAEAVAYKPPVCPYLVCVINVKWSSSGLVLDLIASETLSQCCSKSSRHHSLQVGPTTLAIFFLLWAWNLTVTLTFEPDMVNVMINHHARCLVQTSFSSTSKVIVCTNPTEWSTWTSKVVGKKGSQEWHWSSVSGHTHTPGSSC